MANQTFSIHQPSLTRGATFWSNPYPKAIAESTRPGSCSTPHIKSASLLVSMAVEQNLGTLVSILV